MEDGRKKKWRDIPTYYELLQRESEAPVERYSESPRPCRGKERRSRVRLFPVVGVAGIVLRELAQHFWFYAFLGTLESLPNIAVMVLEHFTGKGMVAWLKLAGWIVYTAFAGVMAFYAYKSLTGERVTVKEAFRAGAASWLSLFKFSFFNSEIMTAVQMPFSSAFASVLCVYIYHRLRVDKE